MIALRKLFQVFGRGSLTFLNPANRKVLAYLRDMERADGSHETVLCVANLSRFAQPVALDLAAFAGMEPVELLGYVPFPTITEAAYALTLAPYSFLWLELQPASSKRAAADGMPEGAMESAVATQATADALLTGGWANWLGGSGLKVLEPALAEWLPQQRWFGAKARTIQAVRVLRWAEIVTAPHAGTSDFPATGGQAPVLLHVEVDMGDSTRAVYQAPVALSTDGPAEKILADAPHAVLARLDAPAGVAVLHDATAREDFRQSLLTLMAQDAALPLHAARDAGNAPHHVAAEPTEFSAAAPQGELIATPPVAPAPITAQPGEAAAPSRSTTPAVTSSGHRMQPRESPTAGDGAYGEGRIDAHAWAAFDDAAHAVAHVSPAEQSNTSIIYGDKLILKLFRRLEPGENPDVEMGRFLTTTAKFPHIAPLLGAITMTAAGGERTTLAMLQGFVPSEGDGWSWFLTQTHAFFAAADAAPGEAADAWPQSVREAAGPALEAAALLGRRTAELHLALSTPTEDAAFSAEAATRADMEEDARRIEAQLAAACDLLKARFAGLNEAISEAAILLLARRRALLERIRALAGLPTAGQRIRIHGDYHLGQTLRTRKAPAGDFILIDFEGEPARSLAERRSKQSPLKDVAGMVRSFSYAAFSGIDEFLKERNAGGQASERLTAWAAQWERAVTAEFLTRYRQTIAANPALLPPPAQAETLLEAYVLEKALYELAYELNHRPAWLHIPLSGILQL